MCLRGRQNAPEASPLHATTGLSPSWSSFSPGRGTQRSETLGKEWGGGRVALELPRPHLGRRSRAAGSLIFDPWILLPPLASPEGAGPGVRSVYAVRSGPCDMVFTPEVTPRACGLQDVWILRVWVPRKGLSKCGC